MPSKKKLYLIDYENVANDWSYYIPAMTASTRVLLFHSPATPTMPVATLSQILAKKVKLELIACTPGTNAMDFQLVTELGSRIAAGSGAVQPITYYIVSRDKGFDTVVSYWTDRGVLIRRLAPPPAGHTLAGLPEAKTATKQKQPVAPAVKPAARPASKTLNQAPPPDNCYISPLSEKQLADWRKRMTNCVATFGHIPPKPRQTLLHIMLTAPNIPPDSREEELRGTVKNLVNKETDYTGGKTWNKMLTLLAQLTNMERQLS